MGEKVISSSEHLEGVRIDRWLWAVRVFKTRSMATEACKKNFIKMATLAVKPSKEINVGDIISVKLGPLQKILQVEGITAKRVSAKLAVQFVKDLTPPEAYEKAKREKLHLAPRIITKKGIGRPTKKQRRELDEFLYPDKD